MSHRTTNTFKLQAARLRRRFAALDHDGRGRPRAASCAVTCSAQLSSPWATKSPLPRTRQEASLCLRGWSSGQTESRVRSARLFGTGDRRERPKLRKLPPLGPLRPRQSLLQQTPIPDQRIVLRTWKTLVALHGLSSTQPLLTTRRSPRLPNEHPC